MSDLHVAATSAAEGPYSLVVTPKTAGWSYSGLRVLELDAGGSHTLGTGEEEMLVLPLTGAGTVDCSTAGRSERFELQGRADVFSRVTDFAYLPRDAEATVSAPAGGRFALPSARCERSKAPTYRAAQDVPVELRGAGSCSRQVVDYCSADWDHPDKLIVVEVLTPGGNWSSYPPHKHDETRDTEAELEEIYYFEIADGPDEGSPGLGYQRVYGTPERPIDVLAEVRSGDVVLIPHGWHGPSMAVPGYDMYYLNVMAGPAAGRAWRICDDPAHAWIRATWDEQPVDPRLPLTTPTERTSS